MPFLRWLNYSRLHDALAGIQQSLHNINQRLHPMSAALDRLTQEVSETKSAIQSAITLIQGLAQQIRDNVDDSAALTALADDLDAQQTSLAQAVTDNTPAAPVATNTQP